MAKKPKPPAPSKPDPNADYNLLGVDLGFADARAMIRREWESVFSLPFPGWGNDALRSVASLAKIPANEIKPGSFFNAVRIYRTAIAKRKPKRTDMVGPFRPKELSRRLNVSLSTLSRCRKQKKPRVTADTQKCSIAGATCFDMDNDRRRSRHEVAISPKCRHRRSIGKDSHRSR